MNAPPAEHRRVERRIRADRRRGIDRRIADRRLERAPFAVERRRAERRVAFRRGIVSRRSWADRRGSGPALKAPLAD